MAPCPLTGGLLVDGRLSIPYEAPPCIFGSEEYAAESVIPPGEPLLRVRARDGEGWLEQQFTIRGVG